MTSPHTIRLHAAWKRMVIGGRSGSDVATNVSLPDRSLLNCDAVGVIYRRHFNRPTGLSDQTTVLLDCGLLPLSRSANLNGQPLIMPSVGLPDIASMLRPHNELEIEVASDRYAEAATASAALISQDDSSSETAGR
jgi:hypothetical protein